MAVWQMSTRPYDWSFTGETPTSMAQNIMSMILHFHLRSDSRVVVVVVVVVVEVVVVVVVVAGGQGAAAAVLLSLGKHPQAWLKTLCQ